MDWKSFLRYTSRKLWIITFLFGLSFVLRILFQISAGAGIDQASPILLFAVQIIAPFSLIPYAGWTLNLVYFYMLASIVSYGIDHPKEKMKLFGIAAVCFLIMGALGILLLFWRLGMRPA
jgi:hypothetical protein